MGRRTTSTSTEQRGRYMVRAGNEVFTMTPALLDAWVKFFADRFPLTMQWMRDLAQEGTPRAVVMGRARRDGYRAETIEYALLKMVVDYIFDGG